MVFFCHSDDQESYKQNTLIIINGIDCYETNTTIIMKHMGILNWKKGTLGNQAVTTRDKKIAICQPPAPGAHMLLAKRK